jgi:hypothetical protein
MKLKACLELGVACGLKTIDECVLHVEIHEQSLFSYNSIQDELLELYDELDETEYAGNELAVEEINKIV